MIARIAGALLLVSSAPLAAQQPAAGRLDSLLGRLEGRWQMTGTVMGDSATYRLDVTRTLQGRFVEMHMEDVNRPPLYEARVFIGVDSAGTGYIAHWLDAFGASSSIPHGTGSARGDTLHLQFAYPSNPFRDIFVYDRARDTWYFRLESADSQGGWELFGEYLVKRR
jgi:hypothetical protein